MRSLIHYIYSSTATRMFSQRDLVDLLTGARANNARLGITGMLLYSDGSFFQVLEGEAQQVDELAQKIAPDPRHTHMVTIIREPIPRRAFGEWTMGFAHVSPRDVGQIVGLNDFFMDASCFGQLDPGRAKKLLAAFKDGRWRGKASHTSLPTDRSALALAQMRPATMNEVNISFAYQPIIDSDTLSVVSFEALVRGSRNEPVAMVLDQVHDAEWTHFDADCRALAIEMAARLGLRCNLHLNFLALNEMDARAAIRRHG